MLDWLGWLADLLLNAGADVASLSVSKDAPDFVLFHSAVGCAVTPSQRICRRPWPSKSLKP